MNTSLIDDPELDATLGTLQTVYPKLSSNHAAFLSRFLPSESQLLVSLAERLREDPTKHAGGRPKKSTGAQTEDGE